MTAWPIVALGQIASKGEYGLNAPALKEGTGVRFIRITDIDAQGRLNGATPAFVARNIAQLDRYRLEPGDILIARSGATAGKAHLFLGLPEEAVFAGYLIRFRVRHEAAMPEYVNAFLQSRPYRAQIDSTKRVAAQPNINAQELGAIRLPLPPLSDQRHIVDLLDHASSIRRLRREAQEKARQVIPALFVEMFGDPGTNPRQWPVLPLGRLTREGDTINYGVVQPGEDAPGGVPVVRVGDFQNGAIRTTGLKRIRPEIEAAYERSRLHGDEVLIACVGSIGAVALADEGLNGANIVRAVARVRVSDVVNRVFLAAYLETAFVQAFFRSETRTVAQPTLNIRQIKETPVLIPPLQLQDAFADRAIDLQSILAQQDRMAAASEHMADALMAKVFSGTA